MARFKPGTREAMLRIKGVGRKKLDEFGDAFISRVAAHSS